MRFPSSPTLSSVEQRLIDALLASPPDPVTEESWVWRGSVLQVLKAAHNAGVNLVCGTDPPTRFVFHGYSVHHELELMVEAGLSPMEALQSATLPAAQMLGEEGTFGTVEVGKRANLLLLAENPLDDFRNTRTIEAVVLGGRLQDRSALLPSE